MGNLPFFDVFLGEGLIVAFNIHFWGVLELATACISFTWTCFKKTFGGLHQDLFILFSVIKAFNQTAIKPWEFRRKMVGHMLTGFSSS